MNDKWWDEFVLRQEKEREEQIQEYKTLRYKYLYASGILKNALHIREDGEQIPDWLQQWNEHFRKP